MDDRVVRRVDVLSERERRLLRLSASGLSAAEIALRLDQEEADVVREQAALLRALGVRTREDAAVIWWGSRAGSHPNVVDVARGLVRDDQPGA